MNFMRKSTEGWSIGFTLLDFSGGIANYAQMVMQSIDQGLSSPLIYQRKILYQSNGYSILCSFFHITSLIFRFLEEHIWEYRKTTGIPGMKH